MWLVALLPVHEGCSFVRSVSVHCGSAELSARHPWSKVSQGQFQEWKVQSLSTRDGLTGLNLLVPLLTNQIVHDEKNAVWEKYFEDQGLQIHYFRELSSTASHKHLHILLPTFNNKS